MSKKAVKTLDDDGFEPKVVRKSLARVGTHGSRLLARSVARRLKGGRPNPVSGKSIAKPFGRFGRKLATQPRSVISAQVRLAKNVVVLSSSALISAVTKEPIQVVEPERGDNRFRDEAWRDRWIFNLMQQAYLMSDRWVTTTIDDVRGLKDDERRNVRFFTGQVIDAIAPSNFVLTNPEVLRTTVRTRGRNLLRGFANLLRDLDKADGHLSFRMSDPDAFEVGKNLANTPGDVVYQNELMQLIQYRPTTEKVHRRPLLVVPPWINKYYILDLGEKKSFIRYWVEKGHTVFVISWVNPGKEHAHKGFDNYMLEGPVAALDAIEKATGEREVNAVGYCIGGTLLAGTLAWLTARDDDRVKSATYLNSMLDFSDVGDLAVFIDEDMVSKLEKAMNKEGYLDGTSMASAFNMLSANNLIWSFFINNYLLGRDTPAFDLLYWNSDTTRMPAAMHSFYLRNMYLDNKLKEPGGIELAGTPIDLSKVTVPSYFASTIEDHIALWTSCYQGAHAVGGPVRFVLGGSGHIAGIINPPARNKYGYQINEDMSLSSDDWLEGAEEFEGSWWPDWAIWAEQFAGGETKARQPGEGTLPLIEPAPGSYLRNQPAPPTPAEHKENRVVADKTAQRKGAPTLKKVGN